MKLHILALAALILGGCYNPSFKDGLACGPGGACPDGTSCGGDNVCRSRGGELPGLDASTGDAAPSCTANTTVCDPRGHIVTCNASGTVASDVACPVGCSVGATACSHQKVSNDLDQYLLDAKQSADVEFPLGTTIIKASSGDVTENGAVTIIPSTLVGNIRVFAFHSLKISGVVQFTKEFTNPAPPAIAFIVDGPVQITRTLDVSGNGDFYGPGGLDPQASTDAACIGGQAASDNNNTTAKGGSGGAGGFHVGAAGGAASTGLAAGIAGVVKFDDTLVPLHGGCAGGRSASGFSGGGGGGAIQIVSATSIEVTELGIIDASGGGGGATPQAFSEAAGGGGGGAILLEAPTIALRGASVVLSTKGGAGAGTGKNIDGTPIARGEDGGVTEAPAIGGFQPTTGILRGGNGATVTVAATPGPSAPAGAAAAGASGGGGTGQARFNTRDGTVTIDGAAMRTPFAVGTLTVLAP
jgi:hypothetical protein